MDHNNDNFNNEGIDNFDILPIILLSVFTRISKWEHQQLAWLDHVE
jgi:hypothetical protein